MSTQCSCLLRPTTSRISFVTKDSNVKFNKIQNVFVLVIFSDNKKGKGSFYIAQYLVRWTAQSALHFLPSLTDLFIPKPTRLLREAF